MTRSTKLCFEVAALAITLTALLAIVALAGRMFLARPYGANGLAIATSMFTAFLSAFVAIAMTRRHNHRREPTSMSIRDELDLRSPGDKGMKM